MHKIDDRAFDLVEYAIEGILLEVSSYPSPGLVSPISNGAHKDMDYVTFIKSTSSLTKALLLCANEGFKAKNEEELFNEIREIGKLGEDNMFSKTGGVNTHKGMLFLMGISIGGTAYSIKNNREFKEISTVIKNMCKDIVDIELKTKKICGKLSHGEKLYKEYGFCGIRGEVQNGLAIIFNESLPYYKSLKGKLKERELSVQVLLKLMSLCDDSTIVHRKDIKTLEYVKSKADNILRDGGMLNSIGRKKIEDLDKEFIKNNISPGGSADLLAITIFFDRVYENKFNRDLK